MPVGAATFSDAVRAGAEIFHTLRGILKKKGHSTGVGDEGGFAPSLSSNREAVEVVLQAVEQAGYKAGQNVFIALDVAASELWNGATKTYEFKKSGEPTRTADEMVALWEDWVRQYPIVSIEDGLAEGDWAGWQTLTKALGARLQLVAKIAFAGNDDVQRGKCRQQRAGGIDEVLEALLPDEPARGEGERRIADAELAPHLLADLGIGRKAR